MIGEVSAELDDDLRRGRHPAQRVVRGRVRARVARERARRRAREGRVAVDLDLAVAVNALEGGDARRDVVAADGAHRIRAVREGHEAEARVEVGADRVEPFRRARGRADVAAALVVDQVVHQALAGGDRVRRRHGLRPRREEVVRVTAVLQGVVPEDQRVRVAGLGRELAHHEALRNDHALVVDRVLLHQHRIQPVHVADGAGRPAGSWPSSRCSRPGGSRP